MASVQEDYMRWRMEDNDDDIIQFLRVVRGNKVIKRKDHVGCVVGSKIEFLQNATQCTSYSKNCGYMYR